MRYQFIGYTKDPQYPDAVVFQIPLWESETPEISAEYDARLNFCESIICWDTKAPSKPIPVDYLGFYRIGSGNGCWLKHPSGELRRLRAAVWHNNLISMSTYRTWTLLGIMPVQPVAVEVIKKALEHWVREHIEAAMTAAFQAGDPAVKLSLSGKSVVFADGSGGVAHNSLPFLKEKAAKSVGTYLASLRKTGKKVCPVCGGEFTARLTAKTCSSTCRSKQHRNTKSAEPT